MFQEYFPEPQPIDRAKNRPDPSDMDQVLKDIQKYWIRNRAKDRATGATAHRDECGRRFLASLESQDPEHMERLELTHQTLKILNQWQVQGIDIAQSALPVYKLSLYNLLGSLKDASDYERQLKLENLKQYLKKYSHYERQYIAPSNKYPAIAVEIETPVSRLTPSLISVLKELGIPNAPEGYWDQDDPLWEVSLEVSYSPWVQAECIKQLDQLGVLSTGEGRENSPLHVNLEIPGDLKINQQNTILNLVFMISLAYLSPGRMKDSPWLDRRFPVTGIYTSDKLASQTAKTQPVDGRINPHRLEIRTPELVPYPDYFNLLQNVQTLSLAAFSFIRLASNPEHASKLDQDVAQIWDKIMKDVREPFKNTRIEPDQVKDQERIYKKALAQEKPPCILAPKDIADNPIKVALFLEKTPIQKKVRRIFKKQATKIRKCLVSMAG